MMRYRGEIDGLRALAVIPVILYHAGIKPFGGGFVGVDVFFVISGYLITSIILNDLRAGSFSIVNFYERRARRILPALFLVMFSSLPFVWFWLSPEDMKAFSKGLIAVPLFVSNFLFWYQSGYFDIATEIKPLIHTWSLGIEEQFYLLFPLFLIMIWRWSAGKIIVALLTIFIASLSASQWGAYNYPDFAFYMLPTRAWELAMGAGVAFYYGQDNIKQHESCLAQWGSLLGLSMIVLSVFLYNKDTPFPGVYALVPTIGAALIIVYATHRTWTGRLLGSKAVVGIGLISYSAYLWHQPIFAFARIRCHEAPTATLMLSLSAAVILVAYLSWRYIERPFRNRHKFTRRQVFWYAVIGSICLISLGILGRKANYFHKYRMSAAQIKVLATAVGNPKKECQNIENRHELQPSEACEYFGKNITWAVFGDSHAGQLAYALASKLNIKGVGVKQLTNNGCEPSYGLPSPKSSCAEWTDAAVAYLDRSPAIKTVIVSYRLNAELFGVNHVKTYPDVPNNVPESSRAVIWQSYINLLQHFQRSGLRVVAVIQAPELRKPVADLIFRASDRPDNIIGVPFEWWTRRNNFVFDRLFMIPNGVVVVDPSILFCDSSNCLAVRGGTSLYIDDNHLSVAGADVVVNHILELLHE